MNRLALFPIRTFGVPPILMMIGAILVYWGLGFGLAENGGFAWDGPVMLGLHRLSRPWLDTLFYAVTRTGDILIAIPVLAMFIYLWRRSEKVTAALYVAAVIAFPLVSLVVKNQFARPRQQLFPPLVDEQTYSFPSGHSLTAMAVYGLAAVLLWQRGHPTLAVISGVWVLLIGLSRVYLGAHYPSDVLASYAAGTILVVIVVTIDRRLNATPGSNATRSANAPRDDSRT
jgi:undecaprenyl-diphosphatase